MAGERRLTSIKQLVSDMLFNANLSGTITIDEITNTVTVQIVEPVTIDGTINIGTMPSITIADIVNLNIDSLPNVNVAQSLITSTPTMGQVNVAAASVTLLAANASRKKVEIRNQHTSGDVYIYFGTPATTANGRLLLNGETYEFPQNFVYTGIITAISANATSKPVSVVEWT